MLLRKGVTNTTFVAATVTIIVVLVAGILSVLYIDNRTVVSTTTQIVLTTTTQISYSVVSTTVPTTITNTQTTTQTQTQTSTSTVTETSTTTQIQAQTTYTVTTTVTGTLLPPLRGSAVIYEASSTSVSCGLRGVDKGDVLFALIQSSGVPQTTLAVKDNASDGYQYVTSWGPPYGMGGAYATAQSGGSITITATVGNGGAGLTLFCFDISDVTPVATYSVQTGSGTSLSVAPFTPSQDSFVIGFYVTSPSGVNFETGAGFTSIVGTPISAASSNFLSAEYEPSSSGTASCPMSISSPQGWGGLCIAFAP
jgi:hypothetical protein